MVDILEHLSKDTLPDVLLHNFVAWCVWEQSRPALLNIVSATGLHHYARDLVQVQDYGKLAAICGRVGQHTAQTRTSNPLGTSATEAAAFLANKMALAATPADFDPEAVAFFAAQVCGWSGFARSDFKDVTQKLAHEKQARQAQAAHLYTLWAQYSASA